jgi:hypothetical protein
MFASLVPCVTTPFCRKRRPGCGHKVRETCCDLSGYDIIEQTRAKVIRSRDRTTGLARQPSRRGWW